MKLSMQSISQFVGFLDGGFEVTKRIVNIELYVITRTSIDFHFEIAFVTTEKLALCFIEVYTHCISFLLWVVYKIDPNDLQP